MRWRRFRHVPADVEADLSSTSSSSFSSSSSSTSRRRLAQALLRAFRGLPAYRGGRAPRCCGLSCGLRPMQQQQLDQLDRATATHLQQCYCFYCGVAGHTTSCRGCPQLVGRRLLYRAMPRADVDQLRRGNAYHKLQDDQALDLTAYQHVSFGNVQVRSRYSELQCVRRAGPSHLLDHLHRQERPPSSIPWSQLGSDGHCPAGSRARHSAI